MGSSGTSVLYIYIYDAWCLKVKQAFFFLRALITMQLWKLQFLFEVQRLIWLKFGARYGTRMVIHSLTMACHFPCDEKNAYFPLIYACVFHELPFLSLPPELSRHVCSRTSVRYEFIYLILLHWIIVALFGEYWRILPSGIWRHVV